MKKAIVLLIMCLTFSSYAYSTKNLDTNLNPIDDFIVTRFYVWEIETNLGLLKGTSLSEQEAESRINLFSKGAIIKSKKIEVISIIELSEEQE